MTPDAERSIGGVMEAPAEIWLAENFDQEVE